MYIHSYVPKYIRTYIHPSIALIYYLRIIDVDFLSFHYSYIFFKLTAS